MPIKWTQENEQLFFFFVLEAIATPVDYNAIADAWPKDQGDTPTPKALSEHIKGLRRSIRARLGAYLSKTPTDDPSTTLATTALNVAPGKLQSKGLKSDNTTGGEAMVASGKRKRGATSVNGLAKMSKRGVYVLAEPVGKAATEENPSLAVSTPTFHLTEENDEHPKKKVKIEAVEVDENGIEFSLEPDSSSVGAN